MVRDFEREYDEYVDDYHGGTDPTPDDAYDAAEMAYSDAREDESWHHEMAEPPEPHDDGDDDIPPPDEPAVINTFVEQWRDVIEATVTSDDLAEVLRRRGWTVTAPDPDAGPLVARDAPETSHEAARRAAVTGGSLEAHILEACLHWGGWTCDEIEASTGRAHGSVSGAMNRLKRKGLVRESGETRPTRGGSPASVYVLTDIAPEYRRSTHDNP